MRPSRKRSEPMRNYQIKSKSYATDYRSFENLDDVRRYIIGFYPAKEKEIYVFSGKGKQYGNVLFNDKGLAFWYTPSVTYLINKNGTLGQIVAKYDKKKKEWHPFGL